MQTKPKVSVPHAIICIVLMIAALALLIGGISQPNYLVWIGLSLAVLAAALVIEYVGRKTAQKRNVS